jgi:flagellar hook assembly protein FlgD
LGTSVSRGFNAVATGLNLMCHAVARFETIPNSTVAVGDDRLPEPSAVRLAAPAPNPLVHRSTFAFELPRAETVNLAIHDLSGRRVRVLEKGALAAGRHQRVWDATDESGRRVAAGMYFVRLESESGHARTSVLVMR